ncbi:hypothetical protein PHET_10104 [Paragonimus heterotremus]|uniref:Uncharacterized protein n=1 Tax=Paragonimus heterotremus TaxID=100268 RepID=A0A8J4SZ17_9TREM|nr:hypothetical protein PHET_10104 [Paragonimus heterotremus]
MVAKAHIDELLDGPRPTDNGSAALVQLSQQMTVCEVMLRQLNRNSDLNSSRTTEATVRRLPPELHFRWADEAAIITLSNREPHFTDLTRFVEELADDASLRYDINALQGNLERLYQQEFIDASLIKKKEMSVGDRQAIGLMETSTHLTGGHHEVALPWRPASLLSPDNRPIALKPLHMLRQRLMECDVLVQHYPHAMGEYDSQAMPRLTLRTGHLVVGGIQLTVPFSILLSCKSCELSSTVQRGMHANL